MREKYSFRFCNCAGWYNGNVLNMDLEVNQFECGACVLD